MASWTYSVINADGRPEICECGLAVQPLEIIALERNPHGHGNLLRCLRCAVARGAPSVPLVIVAQSHALLHAHFARALAAAVLARASTPAPAIAAVSDSKPPITSPGTPAAREARFLKLGQVAYEGYAGHTAGRGSAGLSMPLWPDLKASDKARWASAAKAVTEALD